MELLFVALFGALVGLVARYALPHRATHGALLVPAVGVAAAMVAWVALTWAGLPWDQGVIWIATLGIAALVSAVGVDLAVGRRRAAADARDLAGHRRLICPHDTTPGPIGEPGVVASGALPVRP
ncbi:hypothetical protein [Clavibacter zhangzhiyongii]|uniref:hypothetical protein n=1 Tax=Clavibacter zhangzhiyongii TaxID=2768071 RepID=UPI0039E10797